MRLRCSMTGIIFSTQVFSVLSGIHQGAHQVDFLIYEYCCKRKRNLILSVGQFILFCSCLQMLMKCQNNLTRIVKTVAQWCLWINLLFSLSPMLRNLNWQCLFQYDVLSVGLNVHAELHMFTAHVKICFISLLFFLFNKKKSEFREQN